MLIEGKKIAIAGGGPGGLTLARLLQLKNADVTVYERDTNARVRIQGGALDLHDDSGLAALNKAGLMEAFKNNYRPCADLIRIVDDQANIVFDEHIQSKGEDFGSIYFRPEIDRGPLRDILLKSLKPGTVIWNRQIISIEANSSGWKLFFQNGETDFADILIGADGSNSKIRPFVTSAQPIWAGITMVEGSIPDAEKTAPHIHQLLKGGKIFAFGNQKSLLVSSKGDGSLGFATGCKTDEDWHRSSGIDFKNNKQVMAWFKKEFSAWGHVWIELFENQHTIFIPRPQYYMPLDQHWDTQSNITLLGDAAHWMPPYAGEGVNMAMLDALQLNEALTDPSCRDLITAIASYEKQMLARFAETGRETLRNTEWMHGPSALEDMVTMFGG